MSNGSNNKNNNEMIELIHSRRSIGNLSMPMPSDDELNIALKCAMTAPDHKQLKPWQIVVMTDGALTEFGEVLLQAEIAKAQNKQEILDEAARSKLINMPKRAPMIIMVATNIKAHPKVPEVEQLLSAGAMVQNLLLALQALGYRSIWRTGLLMNEPLVKNHFNIDDKDTICGFIYVGSSDIIMPERDDILLDEIVRFKK